MYEVFEILRNISNFISNYEIGTDKKQKAYKSIIKLRKKYMLGSYPDMFLWRIFREKGGKTIKEYNESLSKSNVMVTSKSEFQSWTKDKDKSMTFWGMNNQYITHPEEKPRSLLVGAEIKGNDILLDIQDFLDYLRQCQEHIYDRNLMGMYIRNIEELEDECEVLVKLKGRKVEVKSIDYNKDSFIPYA